MMIITYKDPDADIESLDDLIDDETILYFGSHNFSPSSWGFIEGNKNQQMVPNWELGVLFMPKAGSKADKIRILESLNVKLPALKYAEDDKPFIPDILE